MSSEFDDFLVSYNAEIQAIAKQARALIFEVIPGVSEHVYPAMKVIRYGLDGNKMSALVCFLGPAKGWVSLGFHHGTALPDPKGLLEGTGKNLRHVKLKKAADVAAPELRALLEAELALAKQTQ